MSLFKPDLDAPRWRRLSNGPARVDLEGFSFSSREKPVNTVKAAANSNIDALKYHELLNMLKEKRKIDEDLQRRPRGAPREKTKTCASKPSAFPSRKPCANRFEARGRCFGAATDSPCKVIDERWRDDSPRENPVHTG
jgi:hypothetical protein